MATFAYICVIMQLVPEPVLPAGSWPTNLVIGYVGGYTYEVSLRKAREHLHAACTRWTIVCQQQQRLSARTDPAAACFHALCVSAFALLSAVAEAFDRRLPHQCQGRCFGVADTLWTSHWLAIKIHQKVLAVCELQQCKDVDCNITEPALHCF